MLVITRSKLKLAFLTILFLSQTACGDLVSLRESPVNIPVNNSPLVSDLTTKEEVGLFVRGERNAHTKEWFTESTTGVFRTYTSAGFVTNEPLMLKSIYANKVLKERSLLGAVTKLELEVKL